MPEDELKLVGKVIQGAVSVAAVLPGVALLSKMTELPASLSTAINALVLACGVLVILLVIVAREFFYSLGRGAFICAVVLLAIIGCGLALFHLNFASDHVLVLNDVTGKSMVALPVHPSPALEQILDKFSGDYGEAAMNPAVGPQVMQLIEAENDSSVLVLVSTLLTAQLALTLALVVTGWRAAHHLST